MSTTGTTLPAFPEPLWTVKCFNRTTDQVWEYFRGPLAEAQEKMDFCLGQLAASGGNGFVCMRAAIYCSSDALANGHRYWSGYFQ